MYRHCSFNWQVELLVEIAVKNPAIPSNTDGVPAHHPLCSCGVECRCKERHVLFKLATSDEEISKTLDGHIVEAVETVEDNAISVG